MKVLHHTEYLELLIRALREFSASCSQHEAFRLIVTLTACIDAISNEHSIKITSTPIQDSDTATRQ